MNATERQPIPVIREPITVTDIDPRVVALLDAALAIEDYRHLALLPNADRFPIVDDTVRVWARSHFCDVREWGHWSSPGNWIEGYRIATAHREIANIHTPQELRRRMPVDDGCGPRLPDAWRPSDQGVSQ